MGMLKVQVLIDTPERHKKILEKERTFLIEGHSVQESYDLLMKESGGPYASSS